MTQVAWIDGVGVRGPGLDGWTAAHPILAGDQPGRDTPTVLVAPAALPPAERRRVGRGVKVALDVGFEAVGHSGHDAATMSSVFASSSGDGDNCDAICRSLATDRLISPTRFHNSVHNAPSGYWGIAAHATAPSTSLCAFDHSFAAGLADAVTQLGDGCETVLLVAYDAPYPEPLHATRPTPDAFGVALVLARSPGPSSIARIEIGDPSPIGDAPVTRTSDVVLERWRASIPAARALPLLEALARATGTTSVVLEDANGTTVPIRVEAPCV